MAKSDPLFEEAVNSVQERYSANIDSLQSFLTTKYPAEKIGKKRCSDMLKLMEANGLVSAMDMEGDRHVLVPPIDPLYTEAVNIVLERQVASIRSLQSVLGTRHPPKNLGYNRCASMIELMESRGLVSAMDNDGNRFVLAKAKKNKRHAVAKAPKNKGYVVPQAPKNQRSDVSDLIKAIPAFIVVAVSFYIAYRLIRLMFFWL